MEISVVIACKNSNLNKLHLAIDSVLTQTFKDFEVIIVDDGSDIPLSHLLNLPDKRVSIYRLNNSVGLGAALNYGISKASGRYIARFDDDDLMVSNRLSLQYHYLELNPTVVCVGTLLYLKFENKAIKYRKFPLNTNDILKDLVNLKFSLAHTSIMFRKDVALRLGGYRIAGGGQDLDFFLQLSTLGELSNINEYLNFYTLSSNGLSVKFPRKKYEAYIFALENFILHKRSFGLEKFILKTIQNLKKTTYFAALKLQSKRTLLILYVRLFGFHL